MKRIVLLLTILTLPLLATWQNPTPIYVGPGDQEIDVVISDGEGGAAVIWRDAETDWNYIQVIDSEGNLKWDADGVPIIATAGLSTQNPDMFLDDDGNYWVALEGNEDIYVQKLSPTGQRLFGDNGVAVCTAEGGKNYPQLCISGIGAIVVWEDQRQIEQSDLYIQRIDASGNLMWPTDGLPLSVLPSNSSHSQNIVHDANGGALVVYWNSLGEFPPGSIYAQRVDSLGNLLWGNDGKFITQGGLWKTRRWAYPDMNGGVFFLYWIETTCRFQHLDSDGIVLWDTTGVIGGNNRILRCSGIGEDGIYIGEGEENPQRLFINRLTLDGKAVCGDTGKEIWNANAGDSRGEGMVPSLTEDGIIVWRDMYDELGWYEQQGVLSQRIDTSGNTLWSEVVIVAGTEGNNPHAIATYDKGAIVAWQTGDIYAAYLDSLGNISGIEENQYLTLSPLHLELCSGNIVNGSVHLRFSLEQNAFVNAAVYDATGRLVRILERQNLSGGIYEINWNGVNNAGHQVPTGVYFVRVAASGKAATEKIILIK